MTKSRAAVAACAVVALGVTAAPASASVVSIPNKGLLLVAVADTGAADPAVVNDITVAPVPGGVTVTDTKALITVNGTGCTLTSAAGALPAVATCADPARTVTHIKAYAGDGNDSLVNTSCTPALLIAGTGDDVVRGGCAADTILGGTGHDRLYGGTGGGAIYTNGRTGDYNTQKMASSVSCVAGTDTTVYANRYDVVAPECKTIIRVAPGQTPVQAAVSPQSPAAAALPASPPAMPVVAPAARATLTVGLRVTSARVLARTLRVRGTLARSTTSTLRVVITRRSGRRTLRIVRRARVNRVAGTFSLTMKLGPRFAHAGRLALGVTYTGDQRYRAQTVRRTITVRASRRH